MSSELIPAIDVAAGRLAVFSSEGPSASGAFGGDPLAAARAYVAAGARRLHVVDLDLAFSNEARNLGTVRAIAGLGVRVQGSGGIGTAEHARAVLDAGADRVVLGSAVLADEAAASQMISELADRALIGIEVEGDRVRSRGRVQVDLPLVQTLGWLVAAGASAFLVTTVARVGSLGGPDVDTVRRVVRAGRPVIAAGGIASDDDLHALRDAGARGAVVGRAFLDGSLGMDDLFGSG
ncbi:MAG TPA: HisA/HisF-related TIM barrel protein [Actinomycetota bacterium]